MTRTLLALGLAAFAPAPASAVIAPPVPRLTEWKVPDAAQVEAPKPGEAEDPAKILERVTQNAKAVGDRLKERDTGDETRKKQDEVLKDIDALLKQNENPPPSGGGGGGAGDPPPPPPMESGNSGGGNSEMKPMGGMGNGNGQPMPMGGNSGGGRPKRGGGMGAGMKEPMMPPNDGGTGTGTKEPMMQPGAGQTPQPAKPGPGGTAMEGKPGGASPPLPNEDPFTKQVWGHLPEKLRQQASQYYREQYMPKYQEMLKRYYSTLAERDRPAKK